MGQHSHGECVEQHKNAHFLPCWSRSSNGCARTHKSSYSVVFRLFGGFFSGGIPQRLLRTEVSYFYSTLLSPVDRGSELCVPCPQTPATLAISLLLVNELKWTQGDMYLREKSRLLKCWGLPCLRRDMVAGGSGVQRGSHRGWPGLKRRLRRGRKKSSSNAFDIHKEGGIK